MIFRRFYDDGLAQASFLIGCPGSGEAVVVDPNRNLETYLSAAAEEGLQIVAVTETHIHADYLSGAKELAERTGARLYLSDEGGPDWRYAYRNAPNVRLLHDGESFDIGGVRLTAIHTPGHTPEHLTFLVTDRPRSAEPWAALTGDFVFVGDVGRPDLLENAAGVIGTAEPGARDLFRSLERFRRFSPSLLLWPGHGAGSACGKALGGAPVTSLGYELATNWAFAIRDEDAFVATVLEGQPDAPPYFARMKRDNKQGPARVADAARLERVVESPEGALVLDVRPAGDYRARHLVGTLAIPFRRSFSKYAGWLVPDDQPITILAESEEQALLAAQALRLIGVDQARAWMGPEALDAYPDHMVRTSRTVTMRSLRDDAQCLDVRWDSEYREGCVPGAVHVPLGHLERKACVLDAERPIDVYCASGGRSVIAASILERLGFEDVADVIDGFDAVASEKLGSR